MKFTDLIKPGEIVAFALGGLLIFSLTTVTTTQYWQNRLIEEQLAEWRVDPATGKVWFKTYAWEDVE